MWSSFDGIKWNLIVDGSPWSCGGGRNDHSTVVLNRTIILMGGNCGAQSPNYPMNDIWISNDIGLTWSLQNSNAAWSARNSHTTVLINENLVLLGGSSGSYGGNIIISY